MGRMARLKVAERPTANRSSGDGQFVRSVLQHLRTDANLIYLAERLRNYAELTESRLVSLREAIELGDVATTGDIARALTDSTARLGAVQAMRICIAMQMLARQGAVLRLRTLCKELEAAYDSFKENLIWAVG